MTTRTARRSGVVRPRPRAATAAAATLATVPAHAASTVVDDGADASGSLTDIRRVRVDHTDRSGRGEGGASPTCASGRSAGLTVYLDSDPDARGPERAVGLPLFSGSDYVMWRMRDWELRRRPTGQLPLRRRLPLASRRARAHRAPRLLRPGRRGAGRHADAGRRRRLAPRDRLADGPSRLHRVGRLGRAHGLSAPARGGSGRLEQPAGSHSSTSAHPAGSRTGWTTRPCQPSGPCRQASSRPGSRPDGPVTQQCFTGGGGGSGGGCRRPGRRARQTYVDSSHRPCRRVYSNRCSNDRVSGCRAGPAGAAAGSGGCRRAPRGRAPRRCRSAAPPRAGSRPPSRGTGSWPARCSAR